MANVARVWYARKGMVDNLRFDSQKEIARYQELKLLQKAGEISQLEADKSELRYRFGLQEYVAPGLFKTTFLKYDSGRLVEYEADFRYLEDGKEVVEDCKDVRTAEYKIKKALMWAVYGIRIKET